MIEIKSLNKFYKSKKRKMCHALKDINLTLPDAGLVFVLGKSGSGKSTLLNLIGGLDNISSGSIEVDGNDLSKFREGDFCNYRNTHIGFIFQDYHLIDELTVYENIVLSLNLRRIEDKDKVKAALEKVDLAGYEDRYPTELSGGEQQRVAIARAIVKNPRIILADEPTGNLDTHTATAIVTLLKELSKDCLILIVSHNVNDANNYADRIIELAKGKIISDKSRNPEFKDEVTLQDDALVYPNGLSLSEKDIDFINEHPNKKFVLKKDKFLPTKLDKTISKHIKIENQSLSIGKELNLSGKFLKNKTLVISLSSFMVAVIMVIMALSQTIINFDSGYIIAEEMSKANQSSMLMNKVVDETIAAQLEKTYPTKISEGDIEAFYNAGYNGKIYPVYNHAIALRNYGTNLGSNTNHFYQTIFMSESFGTLVVDEEFLTEKFGELEFVAVAEYHMPYGVYITDYLADCAIAISDKYRNSKYENLVGEFYVAGYSSPRMYVNGIIDTNYKEMYGNIFENLKNASIPAAELYESEECQSLLSSIYDRLGYCYSTNPDFIDAINNSPLSRTPAHYKLNINGAIDYFNTQGAPYAVGLGYSSNQDSLPNHLTSGWYYYSSIPEIPEGAKYMRIAFDDAIDTYYGIINEVTTLDYALLRFDDNEPISKEIMNFNISKDGLGIHLNGYTGQIEYTSGGASATYVSDYVEIPDGARITEFASIAKLNELCTNSYCVFYDENKEYIGAEIVWKGNKMDEGTIKMDYQVYNEIFGTSYDVSNLDKFVPHKVILSHYEYSDINNENPLFSKEVMIVGLSASSMNLLLAEDVYELFKKDYFRSYSLYLNGTDGIGAVMDKTSELNYQPQSYAVEGIHSMTKAVDVFIPIFELISIFLYIGVIFILMNFSSKMINDKMHEIGILKALGTRNTSVGVVFGLQVMLIALLTCALSTLGYFLFIDVANDVLIESIRTIAPNWTLPDLQFLTFKPTIAAMNCILIFILAGASLIFPMIKIKAIKPVKIIKAKE